MKIQLSLPVSGREEQARKEAAYMTETLRNAGFKVINPFELCADIDEKSMPLSYYWYMCVAKCQDHIAHYADVVVFDERPTKFTSNGMVIEGHTALGLGFKKYTCLKNHLTIYVSPVCEFTIRQLNQIATLLEVQQ